MLALIRSIGPILALVIGLVGGGGLTWAWNKFIDNPAVAAAATARAEDACTIRTQDAAQRATEAERARQQQVGDDALAAYRNAADQQAAAKQAAQDKLQQEIDQHDPTLAASGRSCDLTDDDFDWLRDHGPKPADGGG